MENKLSLGKNARASVCYVASSAIARGAALLATPILTRLLSPSEFGIYALYTSWLSILTVITTLDLAGGGIYSALSEREERGESFILSLVCFVSLLSLSFILLYLPLKEWFNSLTGLTTTLTLLLVLQAWLNCAESLFLSLGRYRAQYLKVSFINTASGILSPALTVLLLLTTGLGGVGRVYAPLLISIVFVLPMLTIVVKRCKFHFDKSIFSYILRRALPLLPHYVCASVIAQIGRIMISRVLGEGALGRYSAAYSFAFAVSIVGTGVFSALAPWINRQGVGSARVTAMCRRAVFFVCVGVLLFLCASPELFSLFVSGDYLGALVCVFPIALCCVFIFLSSILTQLLLKIGKSASVGWVSVVCALLCAVLSYPLIMLLGILGAALAMAAAYLLAVGLKTLLLYRRGLDVRELLFMPLICIPVSVLILFLRFVILSRIFIVLAVLLLLLLWRKNFSIAIKEKV